MSDGNDGWSSNDIDKHVGGMVRMRRKLAGMNQEQLADALGLTFQQVQKYERGANRISASKLYKIAEVLQVPVSYFFDGLPDTVDGTSGSAGTHASRIVQTFLDTPEGLEFARHFPRIERGSVRRHILSLVRTMADEA
jgi:transcriptional regulator with XRE-family HTH domain